MTDPAATLDVAASQRALVELRQARRVKNREAVHWIDAIYRVYMSGLAAMAFVVVATSAFGDTKVPDADAAAFATKATGWLGLAFALAVGVGLRSGGRGGPLTLQAATVQHELMAPVDRGTVLREPAIKQIRFMAFAGACAGAVAAMTGIRQLPVQPVALIVGAAAAFAVAMVAAVCVAMIASGRRLGTVAANAGALALAAWSVADLVFATETSPFTLLGHLALSAFSFSPLSLVPVVLTLVAVPMALAGIGGTSIDDARRRAGLVAQMRFAVTLQDIRTVVLLRRQLSQETPRGRPWIRLRRRSRLPSSMRSSGKKAGSHLLTVWKRDWRSYLRFPAVRIARMVALAVVAGLALGATWNGVRPAFLLAAFALYLAAYDAIEPLGQEVDHPTRWNAMPEDHGVVLLHHMPAAVVVMLVLCGLTTATTLLLVPSEVVGTLAPAVLWVVAFAAAAGAALSTVMGSPDMAKLMGGPQAEMLGFILLFRLVFPPALTAVALAPLFLAGHDPAALNLAQVQNFAGYAVIVSAFSLIYVRFRKPSRI